MSAAPNKKTNSALAEAIRLMSEKVSIYEIGDAFVDRLNRDLSTLLKNVPKVEKADQIIEYFNAIQKFKYHMELIAGPYSV